MEKIAGNWENLNLVYFLCQKLAAKLVIKTKNLPIDSLNLVRSRFTLPSPAFGVQAT